MTKPKNVPKTIYLQVGEDCDNKDDFRELVIQSDITWCQDKINKNDIRYVLDKRQIRRKNDS